MVAGCHSREVTRCNIPVAGNYLPWAELTRLVLLALGSAQTSRRIIMPKRPGHVVPGTTRASLKLLNEWVLQVISTYIWNKQRLPRALAYLCREHMVHYQPLPVGTSQFCAGFSPPFAASELPNCRHMLLSFSSSVKVENEASEIQQ